MKQTVYVFGGERETASLISSKDTPGTWDLRIRKDITHRALSERDILSILTSLTQPARIATLVEGLKKEFRPEVLKNLAEFIDDFYDKEFEDEQSTRNSEEE